MKKKGLILIVALLTIGFASVTASMFLNGKVSIGTNENDFDVYFTEATLDNVESDKVTILEDRKKITFTTDKLSDVGQTSTLDYKVKNNSTQYGADVLMNCTGMDNEYISIDASLDENKIPLVNPVNINAQEIKSGKIIATMIKLPTESEMSLELVCTLNIVPSEEETIVERIPEVIYREEILNGTDPVLGEGLIPVTIANDGTVKKADLYSEWYDYETKRWANAVILEDESINYNDGETIPENNIESYFVWIPKYSYQLWDLGKYSSLTAIDTSKVHTIPIKFGIEDTKDSNSGECTTPMTSGSSGNCKVGDYMTPPAFITIGTNGFWVGKFETGYKGAASTDAAQVNSSDSTKVEIKPNVYSWRGIQIANAHLVSYNYLRELDSHMMKNTEWGAVAYLQHSIYGSASSIRTNNNSNFITGYATAKENASATSTSPKEDNDSTLNYNNVSSVVASTTGNYTGIYDMSGGAIEYMMSVMLNSTNSAPLTGQNASFNSGFIGQYAEGGSLIIGIEFPDSRYLDVYNYDLEYTSFQNRILGDGTAEFGPFIKHETKHLIMSSWYSNTAWFIYSVRPWFRRGGTYLNGSNTSIFDFNHDGPGYNLEMAGFRIILSPQN